VGGDPVNKSDPTGLQTFPQLMYPDTAESTRQALTDPNAMWPLGSSGSATNDFGEMLRYPVDTAIKMGAELFGGVLDGAFNGNLGGAAGSLLAGSGSRASSVLEGANFAQKTFNGTFSRGGSFAGQTVAEVSAAIKSGSLGSAKVPVDFIVRDGNTLILNTRSAKALEMAGVPRSEWTAINRSGQAAYEQMLTEQLKRNNLTSAGTSTVRQSGSH